MLRAFQAGMPSHFDLGPPRKTFRIGRGPVALLLGVASIFCFCQPPGLCAKSSFAHQQMIAMFSPAGFRLTSPLLGTPDRREMETSQTGRSAIEGALRNVTTPSLKAVAEALGITAPQRGAQTFGTSQAGMEVVGDLDGDGVPEVAVEWKPPELSSDEPSARAPGLYMLSWDGKGWAASRLMNVVSPFGLEVLPGSARLIAVVVSEGITAAPYPVIFQFRDHAAQMLWDGRSDSSRYTGYDYGVVRFKEEEGGGVPEMIVSGRADPGLLVFPKGANGRGFEETTIYAWKDHAYVPVRTRHTPNEDYIVYRFIAALHLHEFASAYALIDPQQFLKTGKPSLKLFRELVEKDWPEFLDDHIFQVPAGSRRHVFTLTLENGTICIYHPSFTAGPRYLLTGLERKKASN